MATKPITPLPIAARHADALGTAKTLREAGWTPVRQCDDPRACRNNPDYSIMVRNFHTAVSRADPLGPAKPEPWAKPYNPATLPLKLKPSTALPLRAAPTKPTDATAAIIRAQAAQLKQSKGRELKLRAQLQRLSSARVVGEGKPDLKKGKPSQDGLTPRSRLLLPIVRPTQVSDLTKLKTYVNQLLPIKPKTTAKPAAKAPAAKTTTTKTPAAPKPSISKPAAATPAPKAAAPVTTKPAPAAPVAKPATAAKATPLPSTKPAPLPLPPKVKTPALVQPKPKPLATDEKPQPSTKPTTTTTTKPPAAAKPPAAPKAPKPPAMKASPKPKAPPKPKDDKPKDDRTEEEKANDQLMQDILDAIENDKQTNGEDTSTITKEEIIDQAGEMLREGIIDIGQLAAIAEGADQAAVDYSANAAFQENLETLLDAAVEAGLITEADANEIFQDSLNNSPADAGDTTSEPLAIDDAFAQAEQMLAEGQFTQADYDAAIEAITDAATEFGDSGQSDTDAQTFQEAMDTALGNYVEPVTEVPESIDSDAVGETEITDETVDETDDGMDTVDTIGDWGGGEGGEGSFDEGGFDDGEVEEEEGD